MAVFAWLPSGTSKFSYMLLLEDFSLTGYRVASVASTAASRGRLYLSLLRIVDSEYMQLSVMLWFLLMND
jgi:hypothetical protein